MELIEKTVDSELKDESPSKTVEKIKSIISSYGIETTEEWKESSVPYCYSLRVSVNGTTFGTNGKGVTKEFALASGYGELMERLQLGYIGNNEVQKDGNFSVNDSQSETISATELLSRNQKWYELYSDRLFYYTNEKVSADEILMQYADENGNVLCTPYYCITTHTKEHLPTALRKAIYTANGCAAGNTTEEAIVQALSEIVERNHTIRMATEKITPPDVPEAVLKQYKLAYSIITFLKEQGFKVIIKDCSLGEKFPVVSVCIIDESSGRYHTHFGSSPLFEIALERALTESFQGRTLDSVATFDNFAIKKDVGVNFNNLRSELTKGASEKDVCFFVGEPTFKYNEEMGFAGKNNKELLKECVNYFAKQGYDILVRDCSCLSFPTYQVLIPGYSEVFTHRLSAKYNEYHFYSMSIKALRNPSKATAEELIGLLMHSARSGALFSSNANLPIEIDKLEDCFYMYTALAYANYSLMRFADSVKYIDKILKLNIKKHREYLFCLRRYLTLMSVYSDDKELRKVLEYFHNNESVELLYSFIDKQGNPFEILTLKCDLTCEKNCILYDRCHKKHVGELSTLINTKTKELDFTSFANDLKVLLK